MSKLLPVEGLPVTDNSVSGGKLPAGQYGTLTFIGIANGIPANARLVNWIGERGKEMDHRQTKDGDAFAGRIETLLTDSGAEPGKRKWKTEVAIKLREE